MTQTSGRIFDELGKLMSGAAGAVQGARREIETAVRSQVERVLGEFDVVKREEFDAVKGMAQKARDENDRLKERLTVLEAELEELEELLSGPSTPRPVKRRVVKRSF